MAYNALNNLIDAYIYANGVQAITGQILNGVLKQMVSQLGSGYHLMGVAVPATAPEQNDFAMAYFAATAGEYTDFGGITLAAGEVAVLLTSGNGSWSKQTIYNVPTTTEDLENTAGFITNAVTDLVNYYTKTEVDDTLANYPTLEALATALADYYTKQEMDAELGDRYTKQETDTKLEDYYKKTETYDKDEVDSIVAALSRQEYIVAWDGLAEPDIDAIPAGVTVTYNATPYTGTLAASASTVNKIYMVWNGTAYDMYGTSQDGGYSWVPMGTTSVDLSQYATKAELSQLQQKIIFGKELEKTIASSSFTADYFVNSSGNIVNSGTTDTYGCFLYELSGVKKIKIIAATNYANPYYAFFSSVDNISSDTLVEMSELHSGSAVTEETFVVDVPDNAVALVINYINDYNHNVSSIETQILNPNKESERVSFVVFGEDETREIERENFEVNKFLNKFGRIQNIADDTFGYAVYNVASGDRLRIVAAINYNYPYYAFFSSDNFSSSSLVEMSELHTGSSITEKTFDVIVPSGAEVLVVNYQKYYNCSASNLLKEILNPNPETEQKLQGIILGEERELVLEQKTALLNYTMNTSGDIINAGTDDFGYAVYDVTSSLKKNIIIKCATKYANPYYGFYSSLENISSSTLISLSEIHSGSAVTEKEFNVVIPSNAVALVVNFQKDYGYSVANSIYEILNPFKGALSGKKWVCVGDSLTAENARTTLHYFDYIREQDGVIPVNFGYSGSGYARLMNENHAFYQRVLSIPSDADLVTIFGSFNDEGAGLQLGTIDDSGTTTLAGCINTTIDNIQGIIPLVRLGIIAPTPWDTTRPNPDDTTSLDYQYVDLLRRICERRSIPFLNLWVGSNLRPWDADFRALAYSKDGGYGTHPDEKGHAIIAPIIREFILKLV